MSELATKQAPADDAGTFVARICFLDGPPDGDTDVIKSRATPAPCTVVVSLDAHDVIRGAEPAGSATLVEAGNAVIAYGQVADSDRGRRLQTKLLERGPHTMWSVTFPTDPTDPGSFVSRPPRPSELKAWPDTRRVIERWYPIEISPVRFGACGPACRTLSAKCASPCSCAPRAPALDPNDLKRFARTQAVAAALEEEWGALAIHCADTATRWATGGREQTGPAVKFFNPDGRRAGFWDPSDPAAIYVSRGLSLDEIVETIGHEVEHYLRGDPWDMDESRAQRAADRFTPRYLATLEGRLLKT